MIDAKTTIGWCETFSFPELTLKNVQAKIDTGARTSCLHAFYVEKFRAKDGSARVRFGVHPLQGSDELAVHCEAALHDERYVTDSGGHRTKRCVILTTFEADGHSFQAELTLTDRDSMKFRMLLGRTAMHERFVVDPSASYLLSQ